MRGLLFAVVLGLSLLAGCAAVTPASPTEHQTETKVIIDADAAYITAATALNTAEGTGKMTAVQVAQGESLRRQAYSGLKAIRAAVDARQAPDLSTFNRVISNLIDLAKEFN